MFRNFKEIEEYVLSQNFKAVVALAGSHDMDALGAIVNAKRRGIINAVLVGDEAKTREMLAEMDEPAGDYRFVDEANPAKAVGKVVDMINAGEADLPMKGLVPTAVFLRGILDKEKGFVPPKGLISVCHVQEFPDRNKFIIMTDCVINIEPDYSDKVKIVNNALKLCEQMEIETPKVAVLAPVEVVNPAMQSTIDAAMLSKAADRGQIKGCIIDGPLGMDNAVSAKAAEHKGIKTPVNGDPDVLIFPDLASGNICIKALSYLAGANISAGVATGTNVGVIMTSRSDSAQNKYNSILMGALQTIKK